MIGIWYNPYKNEFYAKYVKTAYFHSYYKVGYLNNYGHYIVALFYILDRKVIQCNSLIDYYNIKKENNTLKKRLINRLIYLLNKLK